MLQSWHFLPFGKLMNWEYHLGPVEIKSFASLAFRCKEGSGSPASPLEKGISHGPAGQVFQVDSDALVKTRDTHYCKVIYNALPNVLR